MEHKLPVGYTGVCIAASCIILPEAMEGIAFYGLSYFIMYWSWTSCSMGVYGTAFLYDMIELVSITVGHVAFA